MLKLVGNASTLSIRHPAKVVAAWLVLVGALAFVGRGVLDRLHDTDLLVPGTPSAAAAEKAKAAFGDGEGIIVMLEGSRIALDRQGPRLHRRLDRLPKVDVLSAWSPGASGTLRRGRERALIIAQVHLPLEQARKETLPSIRTETAQTLSPPVEHYITGAVTVNDAIVKEGYRAANRAEVIAAPIVLLVLLLVFRSPIAAAVPALVGFSVIAAGRGLLTLVGSAMVLDSLALNLMSMMGLALGIDYSLLMVSRFREELSRGQSSSDATRAAAATAGRTVMFAGAILIVAMAVAYVMAPGAILAAASVGIIVATVLSLIAATTVLPATLRLVGPNIDRWQLRSRTAQSSAARFSRWATARPALAAALVLIPLLALAAPAGAVKLGIPSVENLPPDNQARRDFVRIRDVVGEGWWLPFEIQLTSDKGPLTAPRKLTKIDRFQDRIANDPNVDTVLGPGILAKPAKEASEAADYLKRSQTRLARLDGGLARARRGSAQVGDGVSEAAEGSKGLASGAHAGAAGVAQSASAASELDAAIARAAAGSRRLSDGLERTDSGARKLARGARDAKRGADDLVRPANRLARGLRDGQSEMASLQDAASDAEAELTAALAALEAMPVASKTHAQYRTAYERVATGLGTLSGKDPLTGQAVRSRYEGMAAAMGEAIAESAEASRGAGRVAQGAKRLRDGLVDLRRGGVKLRRGTARTKAGGLKLTAGLGRLSPGTAKLSSGTRDLNEGMGRLVDGADRLHEGLSDGVPQTDELTKGLERMESGVEQMGSQQEGGGASAAKDAQAFESGYFVMAGLDRSSPAEREASSFAVNLDRGGTAARIVVVPAARAYSGTDETLSPKLERMANEFAPKIGARASVGGRGAMMRDYQKAGAAQRWPLIVALMALTFIVLVVVFRSLLMALKAIVLNLLTVAAAFGVLALIFQGDSPLLGGPGYLDIISFYAIYSVAFALSMDYEIFLIARMREGYLTTGTNEAAISYGIERTARIITGAAIIMAGVFVGFAVSGVGMLAQIGIGLTSAVLIDATIIRLVLLPASMRIFGSANWWLPGWLDRLLPRVDVEGAGNATKVMVHPSQVEDAT